ncbi:unnamed protein product [Sphagnum jensenii]|uniref:Polyprotein n=1 Tax=Sphagnum jensenii TaxID=128206 RepID=A0ABP1BFA8_9BRYO
MADIRMKLDGIKQEPNERVLRYFERLDKLFQRGKIPNAERRRRFLGLGHKEDRCWKKPKDGNSRTGSANFLEVMLNDEDATLHQLNELCGSESLFSYTRIPRRRVPVETTPTAVGVTADATMAESRASREESVKSKILSHFVTGKISLTPMETVMMIPRELEHLENLVKVAWRKKDTKTTNTQVSMVSTVPVSHGSCSGPRARMTFMVVDTDSYNVLLGLDLLIKIGAIVDIEQGLIQVKRGPGVDVEVLPLTVVNLMQRSDAVTVEHRGHGTQKSSYVNPKARRDASYLSQLGVSEQMGGSESELDSGSSEESDEEDQVGRMIEDECEFENTELEDLVVKEGPQQVLQLILQDKTNNLSKEEIADNEDYVDWIQWAIEEEQ